MARHKDQEQVDEDPEARARQVCLTLLTLAPRTRAQLAGALRKRGIPDGVADEVLARFEDVGLIDLGVDQGIVRKSGAWYTYEGDQLGQGKENARNFLRDNPDLANEIEKRIKEKLGVGPRVDVDASTGAGNSNSNGTASAGTASAGNGSSTSGRPVGNGAAPSRTAATVPGVTV